MEQTFHDLQTLFEQLGLDGSNKAIGEFIEQHSPISANIELSRADFWNKSQASFIGEALAEDADWAEIVDLLDTLLRN